MAVPSPENLSEYVDYIIGLTRDHVNGGLARLMQFGGFGDVELSANGCVVTTASGNALLDFVGGFGVFSLGHRHPEVVAAVQHQLSRMPLSTRTFFNAPQALLAQRLAQITPGRLTYSFFCNSGAEAVEAAMKIARIATGRTDFISTIGSYHGKTFGSLSATGREAFRTPFAPLLSGFVHVPYGDWEAVAGAITDRTAAVIVEPIQGEGGIIVPPSGYLSQLRKICTDHGILLVADEVQTGLGRTGRMFGVDHEQVVPDIMTLAKALGGGVMPIGAAVATPEIWEATFGVNPLIHTSTFGGNPLACAAALAAIEATITQDLPAAADQLGRKLIAGLSAVQQEIPTAITDVRGLGLMVGVQFSVKDVAELTINGLARRGVIAAYTLNNPNVIRFEPPLIVTEEQLDTCVAAFREAAIEAHQMLAEFAS